MHNKLNSFKKKHKVLFAILIGFSVVSFWRGVWGILDVFVFPNNYALSSIVSLVFGIGLLAVTNYIIEELM
jgi:hypothetical protein